VALKGYLAYAESGVLDTALFTGREPDSDFEVEVATALRGRGFDVVAQVGVAGYFLDLAVKHPDKPDAFILGIECDGATYHSSLSARDRDRLRQAVLEDLGWNVLRVWSTDWYKQREREIDRIVGTIDAVRRRSEDDSAVDDEWSSADDGTITLDDDPGWIDEITAQPISDEQARDALLTLREAVRSQDPSIDARDSILSDEMIRVLIKTRPETRDDWLRHVPMDMRLETNGSHVMAYLPQILEVTRRLVRL
jgi:very-short-patch-repair endonuclease